MNSEKVKEIKKGLEYCTNHYGTDCYHCPYLENGCNIKLMEDSLTLINELESENEKLKQHKRELQDAQQDLIKQIAELEKGKEETMKAWFEDREGMFWDGVREGELKGYKQLKQFAERLKAKAVQEGEYEDYVCYLIDRLLEEYGIKDE